MVVYQNTLPAPFPTTAEPTNNGKPPSMSDFAAYAPDTAPSFSKRFDAALQSRQTAPKPPANSTEAEPRPAESQEKTESAAPPNTAAKDETASNTDAHKTKADDKHKAETSAEATTGVPAITPPVLPGAVTQAVVVTVVPPVLPSLPDVQMDSVVTPVTAAVAPVV